jgi:hypothetical protein
MPLRHAGKEGPAVNQLLAPLPFFSSPGFVIPLLVTKLAVAPIAKINNDKIGSGGDGVLFLQEYRR